MIKTKNKLQFQHIQTLRFFAFLLVFLFHINPNIFYYGFVGVDIFFVISGYVITKSLVDNKNLKNRIKVFLIKRFLRLCPLYFFFLGIFYLAYLCYGPLTEIKYINDKIIYSFFYFTNFYYLLHNSNYFENIFADPINHLWSLSVEFHFYIFYVFLFYFLTKKNYIFIKKTIFALIIISIIIVCIIPVKYYNFIFYFSFLRFWEILVGALIYLNKNNTYYKKINVQFFIFLALIISLFNNTNLALILLSIFFTHIFLSFYKDENKNIFINNKIFNYLGNISYSLYLWHLPVIFFFSLYYAKEYSYYFSFFITVLLSSLSYFLIENKFKDIIINFSLKRFFIKSIIIATFFLIITILIMGNFPFIKNEILKNNYLEKKYSLTNKLNYSEIRINNNPVYKFCTKESKTYTLNAYKLREECLLFSNNESLIYVEGNSHTAIFIPLLTKVNSFANIYYEHNNEDISYEKVNWQLKHFKKITYVKNIDSIEELTIFTDNIKNFNKNINFLIIGTIPNFDNNLLNVRTCLIQRLNCDYKPSEDYKKRNLEFYYAKINSLIKDQRIYFYNPYKTICPNSQNCSINNYGNIISHRDGDHLTIEGSLMLLEDFKKFIKLKNIQ
jgi:peptidoglycan/LPS O-acetylase OafA/YrhL